MYVVDTPLTLALKRDNLEIFNLLLPLADITGVIEFSKDNKVSIEEFVKSLELKNI